MRGVLLYSICILFTSSIVAQPTEYVFRHLTKEEGLAANWVSTVIKDHKGLMWFATHNGMQSFDGKRFSQLRHNPDDATSLPDNPTGYIREDSKKRLWVWTDKGPAIYDRFHMNFRVIPIDYKKEGDFYGFQTLNEDSKGNILLCLQPGELFFLDETSLIFKPYTSLWPKSPYKIVKVIPGKKLSGIYWIATDSGLVAYDSDAREYYHNSNNPKGWKCFTNPDFGERVGILYQNNQNILWLLFWKKGAGATFYHYNSLTGEIVHIKKRPGNVSNFLTDSHGTTWAYGEVLSKYDQQKNSFTEIQKKPHHQVGIDFDNMFSLYQDDEQNLWASTNYGVYIFNPYRQVFSTNYIQSFEHFQRTDANITGFIPLADGNFIALGWGNDGLYFFDSAFNPLPRLYGYEPRKFYFDDQYLHAWCGLQDFKGIIWVGCQAGRILKIEPGKNKITALHPPQFIDKTIRSIAEDKNGNIWFGKHHGGLVKWNRQNDKFESILSDSAERYRKEGHILKILPGEGNDIWATSVQGGLLQFDIETGELKNQYTTGKNPGGGNISSNTLWDIVWMNKHTLVISSNNGINFFDTRTSTFTNINEKDGLPSTRIKNIIFDDANDLWFTSFDGLWKLNLKDTMVTHYGVTEGITHTTFLEGAIARLNNGKLLLGSTRGYVGFNPLNINAKTTPPDVRITGFKVFNQVLSVDSLFEQSDMVHLRYTQNYFSIQFSSMSYRFNNTLDYYYKLEGVDKDWVHSDEHREANYTYLPGGRYKFMVRAVSSEGLPSQKLTSFMIHIHPPFWETWWFYLICALFLSGMGYMIYRIRIERLLGMEKVRHRISRDLHDDMGSTLSTINILSSMAKSKMQTEPAKTSEFINKISENCTRMMEAMSDIVWSINPQNDSIQKIIARMREFAASALEPRNIDYRFSVDPKIKTFRIGLEERRDLFLIFKEAINNLAKYSDSKNAQIEIKIYRKKLYLRVKDDGRGFDVKNADNGNGLNNMKKRAKALRGKIRMESVAGKGTTVMLEAPLT